MKTIAVQWEEFVQAVGLSDAPPIQISEMRRAFYAGAESLFRALMVGLDPDAEPTDADMARMEAISEELQQFGRDVGEGRK